MYKPFDQFHINGRCISVIGSGGKTTFLRYLSEGLPGRVILTTSTHIFPFSGMPLVKAGSEDVSVKDSSVQRELILDAIRSAFALSRVICLGRPLASGKLSDPSGVISFEDLLSVADFVLVEADGSAGRPLKAHRPWEPVIVACSSMTVGVVGSSGIGKRASQACHCSDLFCAMAGIAPDQPVNEEHIAKVLNRENLADCYLVNQVDTLPDPNIARRLCDLIAKDAFPCSLGPR